MASVLGAAKIVVVAVRSGLVERMRPTERTHTRFMLIFVRRSGGHAPPPLPLPHVVRIWPFDISMAMAIAAPHLIWAAIGRLWAKLSTRQLAHGMHCMA